MALELALQNRILEPTLAETLSEIRAVATHLCTGTSDEWRRRFSVALCTRVVEGYWRRRSTSLGLDWPVHPVPAQLDVNSPVKTSVFDGVVEYFATVPAPSAGYAMGVLYTNVLPAHTRASLGAYYTPPTLVERLLDMVEQRGVNWADARILDPACGGAAFLAAVAKRIRLHSDCATASRARTFLQRLAHNLKGFEIDPLAAWMSQVLVEAEVLEICARAGKRLKSLVRIGDALRMPIDEHELFDVVIGNPPYGRVKLPPDLRRHYAESLYGHANLYGLFTDLALRWTKPTGLLGYVTPTSFLAGQYYKSLRKLLSSAAKPVSIDFVSDRAGVFENVLQETLLVVFDKRANGSTKAKISELVPNGDVRPLELNALGKYSLPRNPDTPWLFPRSKEQRTYLKHGSSHMHRLRDYGYEVNTGQLVWNRHKSQLVEEPFPDAVPLIWAESVCTDGMFRFRATRKNHTPYIRILPHQTHLLTHRECVLVQRTTAKEQNRRLLAAVLPAQFLAGHPNGVVVENHLNIVRAVTDTPEVAPTAISALLNSRVLDLMFRCISGTVAVSAYELNCLPLPAPDRMDELLGLLREGADPQTIECYIETLYRTTS